MSSAGPSGTRDEYDGVALGKAGVPFAEFVVDCDLQTCQARKPVAPVELAEQFSGRARGGLYFFGPAPGVFPENGEILDANLWHAVRLTTLGSPEARNGTPGCPRNRLSDR